MTDTNDDGTESEERVLVRPYVTTEPKASSVPPGDRDTAVLPTVPVDEDTAAHPVVAAPRRRSGLSVPMRLLVLAGGVAVALGVGAYLIFSGGGPGAEHRGVLLLPRPDATEAPAVASVGPATHLSASPSSPSPSASPSSASASASSAPSSAPTGPSAAPSTTANLAPPAADRTGAITAAGGRCLALGSLLGMDGSPVTVSGCANVAYQRFTLAADGTLRVNNRCAAPTGDGSVRVDDCDTAPQWRAGPDGSLVSGDRCLTDPGRAGATTTVAACSGGDSQRWTVP